jgi:hypothetical protein
LPFSDTTRLSDTAADAHSLRTRARTSLRRCIACMAREGVSMPVWQVALESLAAANSLTLPQCWLSFGAFGAGAGALQAPPRQQVVAALAVSAAALRAPEAAPRGWCCGCGRGASCKAAPPAAEPRCFPALRRRAVTPAPTHAPHKRAAADWPRREIA